MESPCASFSHVATKFDGLTCFLRAIWWNGLFIIQLVRTTMGSLVYLGWKPRHCYWNIGFRCSWSKFWNLDVKMSTNSSFFNRLFISVVVFHGLSSIQCHTSDNGSCNLTRCLHRKNSGLAPCRSCSHILLLNSRWYVTWSSWLSKFSRNLECFFSFLTLDRAFPSHRWSPWHEHLPGSLPVVEVNGPPDILFLRFWGLLPFPR